MTIKRNNMENKNIESRRKFMALTAVGTFAILTPQLAQANSYGGGNGNNGNGNGWGQGGNGNGNNGNGNGNQGNGIWNDSNIFRN